MAMHDGRANELLGALVRELIDRRGTSRRKLAPAIRYDRKMVVQAAAGRGTTEGVAIALDRELEAGGRIVAYWEADRREKAAERLREVAARRTNGVSSSASAPVGRTVVVTMPAKEVGPTDRRQLAAAGLSALSAMAADLYRVDAPELANLDALEDLVDDLADGFATIPRAAVVDTAGQGRAHAERIRRGAGTDAARQRATLAAGQLAFAVSRAALHLGELRDSRKFARLAALRAGMAGDAVLVGACDVMSAWFDLEGRQFVRLEARCVEALRTTHPYVRPRLLAYLATSAPVRMLTANRRFCAVIR